MYKNFYYFTRNYLNNVWDIPNPNAFHTVEEVEHHTSLAKYINDNMSIEGNFMIFCNGNQCAVNSENPLTVQQQSELDTLVFQYKSIN